MEIVTSFQLQRVSNLALPVLSSRVSLLFVLLPTRDVSPHNSSQFATSFAFRNLHNAICFLSARRFASLLLTFSRFSLILFLTVVLATATFFFTELSHLEQFFTLDSSLATGWEKTISVRITFIYCFLFFVCTIVKVISRSPDSLGFIFCMLASRPSLLC